MLRRDPLAALTLWLLRAPSAMGLGWLENPYPRSSSQICRYVRSGLSITMSCGL